MNRPLYIFQRRKIMQLSHHSLLKTFSRKKSFHDNYPQKIIRPVILIFQNFFAPSPHISQLQSNLYLILEIDFVQVVAYLFIYILWYSLGESDFLNTEYGKDLRLVVRIEPVKYANAQTHQEIVDYICRYTTSLFIMRIPLLRIHLMQALRFSY